MNLEAQKLFIGPVDFFSILLPCVLLTLVLMGEVGPVVLGDRYAKVAGAEAWAAFLLGSWLDEFCDGAGRCSMNTQTAALARREVL